MPKKIDDMLKFQIKVVEETLQTTNLHVSTDAPVHEGDGEEFTTIQLIAFFIRASIFSSLMAIWFQLVVFTNIAFIHKI